MSRNLEINHLNIEIFRLLYSFSLIFVFPQYVSPSIGLIPSDIFSYPVFFREFVHFIPSSHLISILEVFKLLSLIFVLFNWFPRFFSLICFSVWIFLHGIEFGLGKIDHHLVLASPLLWFGIFGWKKRLLPVYLTIASLSSFYFTAGLIKLLSGYLFSQDSAIRGILEYYRVIYGINSPALAWEIPYKIFDILTVLFEVSFVILFFIPEVVFWFVVFALFFHFGVKFSLGIDFIQLFTLYIMFMSFRGYDFNIILRFRTKMKGSFIFLIPLSLFTVNMIWTGKLTIQEIYHFLHIDLDRFYLWCCLCSLTFLEMVSRIPDDIRKPSIILIRKLFSRCSYARENLP